jgi:hypothetical protein
VAVFKDDTKTLGLRRITLKDRLAAAAWLGERGWGRTPLIEDLPEEPQVSEGQDFVEWAKRLPPDLRKALGAYMDAEFERQIEADIAVVDKQIKATMPDGWSPSRPVRQPDGSTKVPE